jgi:hypothetical protein
MFAVRFSNLNVDHMAHLSSQLIPEGCHADISEWAQHMKDNTKCTCPCIVILHLDASMLLVASKITCLETCAGQACSYLLHITGAFFIWGDGKLPAF